MIKTSQKELSKNNNAYLIKSKETTLELSDNNGNLIQLNDLEITDLQIFLDKYYYNNSF